MYNSNRPRSPFYIGTGHFRHNHFKDIVWYSSITKMVLYVQCDLWTFCGADCWICTGLQCPRPWACKSIDGKLSSTLLWVKLSAILPHFVYHPLLLYFVHHLVHYLSGPHANGRNKKVSGTDRPTHSMAGVYAKDTCLSFIRLGEKEFLEVLFLTVFPLRFLLLFLWLTSVCRSKAMKGSLIIFPMKTS